jgi:hypothetical protein
MKMQGEKQKAASVIQRKNEVGMDYNQKKGSCGNTG